MKTIHLQGVGEHEAMEVEELRPGMITVWNWGVKKEIAGVWHSVSFKTHRIVYADGTIDHRKMRTGRLVAVEM